MTGKTRVLVVDDDVQIRRALRHVLAARGYDVLLAATGEEAVETAAAEAPELMILDLGLPEMSGLDVCREVRGWSQMPILVLTVNDRSQDKVAALDLGADDYLTKPFDTQELLARIRVQLRRVNREPSPSQARFEVGGLQVDLAARRVVRDNQEIHLTPTEFSILGYLLSKSDRVVTYGLLLANVWGGGDQADLPTLRTHTANLRRKIEADPEHPAVILTEPGVGYRLVSNPPEL